MSGISKLKERPIQIVEERNNNYSKNKEYVLNEKALSYILMRKCDNESILNLPVMLVSIAGDYRKGKSFFLNFLIRYLKNPDDFESWINDPNSKLDGFISRFGQSLETVGIWMWSEPFVLTDAKGNKVVILLMDTQGTFDRKHSKKDNLTILSLSFMTSSLQIMNFMKNVQDNDLEMLDYFINYCLSAYDEEKMMYANLILLIRDWIWSSESEFGFWGGNCLLKSEFSSICPNLEKCFQKVNCFLMPKPGKRVEEDKKYDGSLCDVEKLFKKHILEFTSEIFNREKLAIKKINGNAMTCRDLSSFMFHYIKLLKSDEMPKVETYLEMNIMLNNLKTINQLCDWYKQQMRETIKQKYLDIDSLNRLHTAKVNEALKKFDKVRKIGNAETNIQDYKNKLQNKIEDEYIHFKNENHLRKSFNDDFKEALIWSGVGLVGAGVGLGGVMCGFCLVGLIPAGIAACAVIGGGTLAITGLFATGCKVYNFCKNSWLNRNNIEIVMPNVLDQEN